MKLNVEFNALWLYEAVGRELITDDTMITIKFPYGRNIARGHWFSDDILDIMTSRLYKVVYFLGETKEENGKRTDRFVIEVEEN